MSLPIPTPPCTLLRRSCRGTLVAAFAVLLLASPTLLCAKGKQGKRDDTLARAQELLDAEKTDQASALLEPYLAKNPGDAEALLLRSTAHFMNGEMDAGRQDLARSLELDPSNRQAWLNRGALAIADTDYDTALDAFLKAEKLDPSASDNALNIGAVLLLQGKLGPASDRFRAYLEAGSPSADAYYLVATNYAMAGYAALAVENLKRSIELDERSRLRARTDPNFRELEGNSGFQQLLATDGYKPPPGAYSTSEELAVPYDPEKGTLLNAVVDALQAADIPYDPRVEVTPRWTLIWGDLRIKLTTAGDGRSRIDITAPPGQLTPAEWKQRVDRLFATITTKLIG